MDRLISLFREASNDARERLPGRQSDDDDVGDAQPGLDVQPAYFVQLMEYLRQEKAKARRAAARAAIEDDAFAADDIDADYGERLAADGDEDMLIGACDAHR